MIRDMFDPTAIQYELFFCPGGPSVIIGSLEEGGGGSEADTGDAALLAVSQGCGASRSWKAHIFQQELVLP